MKRYLKIYKTLIKINFSRLLIYRINFFNSVISSVAWGLFSIFTILILTGRVNSVYGWDKDEIILLTGVYGIVIGMFHMLFSRNFEIMSNTIYFGRLDSVLLKPLDSQFILSLNFINFSSVLRILIGVAFTWYMAVRMNLELNIVTVTTFSILILIGLILFYSIWYIVLTSIVKYPQLSNLVNLLYNLSNISRFPREMFLEIGGLLFFLLLPFTYVVITPAKTLLQKVTASDLLGLFIFTFLLFLLSRVFWKFALRYYTSASG